MKLSDIMSNPARMKIMQYLQRNGEATTKQLSEAIPEVPAPTLYRHINFLLKEELLIVKEERRVRGSVERLLAFNAEKLSESSDIADTAYQFLMAIYGSFQKYSERENADPLADKLSLRTFMFTLTDETFDCFFKDLKELYEKYSKPEKNGKNRSISFISAPVEDEGK